MFHLQMAVVRVFITVEKWLLFIRSELSRATNVPPVILIVGPWAFGVLEGWQVDRWLASRAGWRADVLRDRTVSLFVARTQHLIYDSFQSIYVIGFCSPTLWLWKGTSRICLISFSILFLPLRFNNFTEFPQK